MDERTSAPLAQSVVPRETDPDVDLLRTARHDFKTPLTSLRMLAQMFEMGLEKGTLVSQADRTARNCRMMIDQVDRLVMLADIFSDIALLISGKFKLERQRYDLRVVIREAAAQMGSKAIDLNLGDEPLWGEWDVPRMVKVLKHLFALAPDIAVKAWNEQGEVHVKIDGEFKRRSEKSDPAEHFARVITERHGGRVVGNVELIFSDLKNQQGPRA